MTDQRTEQRKAFEQWYACNAFDYVANPIGSRECGLQWAAWQAAQPAQIHDNPCLNDYVNKAIRAHMAKLEAFRALLAEEPSNKKAN